MAAKPIKYTFITPATGFTCKNGVLVEWAEMDSTLIGLNTDIINLSASVALTSHTQQTDRYLQQGLTNEFDSNKFIRRSAAMVAGEQVITFNNPLTVPPFANTLYLLWVWGWDGDGNQVSISIKDKTANGFTAILPVDCTLQFIATI